MRFRVLLPVFGLALSPAAPGGVITFTDITVEAGLTAPERGVNCTLGDIDEDGDLDIIVWNQLSLDDKLYRNDGTAHFKDISDGSGINATGLAEFGGPFADFDNDMNTDVFVVLFDSTLGQEPRNEL